MSAADVNTAVEAAVTAIEAGDWAAAQRNLLVAKARLSAMPDQKKGSAELTWDRAAIDSLMADVKGQISASTGIQRVTYARVRPGMT